MSRRSEPAGVTTVPPRTRRSNMRPMIASGQPSRARKLSATLQIPPRHSPIDPTGPRPRGARRRELRADDPCDNLLQARVRAAPASGSARAFRTALPNALRSGDGRPLETPGGCARRRARRHRRPRRPRLLRLHAGVARRRRRDRRRRGRRDRRVRRRRGDRRNGTLRRPRLHRRPHAPRVGEAARRRVRAPGVATWDDGRRRRPARDRERARLRRRSLAPRRLRRAPARGLLHGARRACPPRPSSHPAAPSPPAISRR